MTTKDTVVSTDGMRAEADQLRAAARDRAREAFEADRRGAQLAYEATLIDAERDALAVLEGTRTRGPALQAAVDDAVAAERAAEDRVRRDARALARLRARELKAESDYASLDVQTDLAVRVGKAEQVVAKGREVAGHAQQAREQAEAKLAGWEAAFAEADRDHAEAARQAADPGTAPDTPRLAPGVAGISDLDDDTRSLIASVVLLTAKAGSGTPALPAARAAGPDWRADLADQDRRKFRQVRLAGGTHIIPPAGR